MIEEGQAGRKVHLWVGWIESLAKWKDLILANRAWLSFAFGDDALKSLLSRRLQGLMVDRLLCALIRGLLHLEVERIAILGLAEEGYRCFSNWKMDLKRLLGFCKRMSRVEEMRQAWSPRHV